MDRPHIHADTRAATHAALAQITLPDGLYLLPTALAEPGRTDEAWWAAEEQIAALVLIVSLLIVVAVLSLA